MTESEFITRKELAVMLGLSVRTLKRRERELGFVEVRLRYSRQPVLYRRAEAKSLADQLSRFGPLCPAVSSCGPLVK